MKNRKVPKAHELPSGNWRVQVVDESGKRISITEPSEPEAVYAALEFIEQRKRKSETGLTVGEAIDNYLAVKSNILSPTTIREYRRVRMKSFKSIMGKYISRLKASDYQDAVNAEIKLSEKVVTLAPKTIRNTYGVVRTSIKFVDKYAPCDDVVFAQKEEKEIVIPSTEQIVALINYFINTAMQLIVMLAAFCGMRRSEILGLHVSDWNGKNNTFKIRRALVYAGNGEYVEKQTKTTKSTRIATVPSVVVPIIEREIKGKRKDDRIFDITVGAMMHRYEKGAKAVGMEDINFHALRHYAASVMKFLGIPDTYAAARLGHATVHMVRKVYQHIMTGAERDLFDKQSNDYFDEVCTQ